MKTVSSLQFRIDQLRKDKMIYALESIAVSVLMLALFSTMPYVVRTIYAKMESEQPAQILVFLDDYTPIIATVISLGFFLFAMIGNEMRVRKIHALEKELEIEMMADDGCGCGHGCVDGMCDCAHDHHHEELIMEEVEASKPTPKKKKSK